jgi:D-aminoacyl-tRNA deacylase
VIGIACSRADSAATHVCEHLLDQRSWASETDDERPAAEGGGTVHRHEDFALRTFEELHLRLETVADAFETDPAFVVFPSRHSGETGPLLTAHFTGNFGPADHGGDPNALARACPNAHSRVLAALDEAAPPDYAVGTECTHHGPSAVGAPAMFVEVGSDREQWADPAAAAAVARAILSMDGVDPDRGPGDRSDPATGDSSPNRHANAQPCSATS